MSSDKQVLILVLLAPIYFATGGLPTSPDKFFEWDTMQMSPGREHSQNQHDLQQKVPAIPRLSGKGRMVPLHSDAGEAVVATSELQRDSEDKKSFAENKSTLVKRSLEQNASKLQKLKEISDDLSGLLRKIESYVSLTLFELKNILKNSSFPNLPDDVLNSTSFIQILQARLNPFIRDILKDLPVPEITNVVKNSITSDLADILERLFQYVPSTLLVDDEESQVIFSIRNHKSEVLKQLVDIGTISGVSFGRTFEPGASLLFKVTQPKPDLFLGYPIFSRNDFELASTYDDTINIYFANYIVYPDKSSPFRPLPVIEFPLTRWQIVEVTFVEKKDPFSYQKPTLLGTDYSTQYLILQWTLMKHSPNLKHACALWINGWTLNHCLPLESPGTPKNISCRCSWFPYYGIDSTMEFIMYMYEEDIESTFLIDQTFLPENISQSDILELTNHTGILKDFVSDPENSSSFGKYMSRLSIVMRYDNDLLAKTFDDKVINGIGTTLDKVKPGEGRSTIGIRNNDLATFIINLDQYKRILPIGFGVFNNYSHGMKYFRVEEDNDYALLFFIPIVYSFLLSSSVLNQTSRYAFLLYPPDKFFKPAAVIDEHKVSSMRVLDLVLSPRNTSGQDQFVYLFSGSVKGTNLTFGCAYWSKQLSNWTSKDCSPDPDFHDGVCKCNMTANFVESRTRGQYLIYKYATSLYVPETQVGALPESQAEKYMRAMIATFIINERSTSINILSPVQTMELLSFAAKSSGVKRKSIDYLIKLSRDVAQGCTLESPHKVLNRLHRFFYIPGLEFLAQNRLMAFSCDLYSRNCTNYMATCVHFNKSQLFSNDVEFTVFVSPFIMMWYQHYAFILYPAGVTFRPPPQVADFKVDSFQVIEVVVLPPPTWPSDNESQYIEFYFDHPTWHTIGCAYWSDEKKNWTDNGCVVAKINSMNVCNCSLTANFVESRAGGQYIAYSYPIAIFNDSAYQMIGSESFVNASVILKQGEELIRNGSRILAADDADMATKIMHIYCKILLHSGAVPRSQRRIKQILKHLDKAFDRFYINPFDPVSFIYNIPTFWSVKNADVATDMFSNAVLSSGDIGSEVTKPSAFALAVIGHLNERLDRQIHGIRFPKENTVEGEFFTENNITSLVEYNPQFALFVTCSDLLNYNRFVFVVYPLNLSPYNYSMTDHPIFNTRQVDIYVDVGNEGIKDEHCNPSKCKVNIQVYFQPTENPKPYIRIGCSTWVNALKGWTKDVCKPEINFDAYRVVSCKCKISGRKLTRIMMYEYTELVNFSSLLQYDGPSVAFIACASFSLAGFVLIAVTAILIPNWREELSNKVLMHLASSSFLYLVVAMYRETHLIFADMKRLDLTLVAFTAFVHYTRLVHFSWGLTMSVLQYMKFSSVVGASASSHLLLKVSLLAWGTPLLPVAVLLSWNQRAHFCSPDKPTHYVLYLVPAVVITLLNIGLLAAIIRNMTNGCGLCGDKELQKHGGSKKEVLKRQLKQVVMMFFLFGIPTLFEMFNDIASHSIILAYIDKILNPIQGFVMFLFFVVMNDKTRGLWNVHVFGDVQSVVNPAPAKKMVFKVKARKKTKKEVKKPKKALELPAEAIQTSSAEPEIQIIATGASLVADSVKYVAKRGGASEDQCSEDVGDTGVIDNVSDNCQSRCIETMVSGTSDEGENPAKEDDIGDADIEYLKVADAVPHGLG